MTIINKKEIMKEIQALIDYLNLRKINTMEQLLILDQTRDLIVNNETRVMIEKWQ